MAGLEDLGLSSYEERAYRALLSTGPATARTVAERSAVPEGRIYDVLNGLETRGVVESRPGDPREYVPADPDDAVDRLLSDRLEDLEAAAERYRTLAGRVRSSLAPTPPVEGNVWLSGLGDGDATTLIGEQLSAATDRFVMAVGPPYATASPADYRREVDAFLEHLAADVDVDVLVDRSLVEAHSTTIDRLGDAGIDLRLRRTAGVDVTFDVVDGTEAYVDVPHPFADGRRFGFVEVREPTIARKLERTFDDAWIDAEPLR